MDGAWTSDRKATKEEKKQMSGFTAKAEKMFSVTANLESNARRGLSDNHDSSYKIDSQWKRIWNGPFPDPPAKSPSPKK